MPSDRIPDSSKTKHRLADRPEYSLFVIATRISWGAWICTVGHLCCVYIVQRDRAAARTLNILELRFETFLRLRPRVASGYSNGPTRALQVLRFVVDSGLTQIRKLEKRFFAFNEGTVAE